jgi:hypothetical protein
MFNGSLKFWTTINSRDISYTQVADSYGFIQI